MIYIPFTDVFLRLQGTIVHVWSETCLDISKDKEYLVVNPCKKGRTTQQWTFSRYQQANIEIA